MISQELLKVGGVAFLLAFLATPLVRWLAFKIGAVDLPAHLRKSNDRSTSTRIHEGIKPRLGGLAVAFAFLTAYMLTPGIQQLGTGIFFAIAMLTIMGALDDRFQLGGKYQLLTQVLAAMAVIWSGISIPGSLDFLGFEIRLDWWVETFTVGSRVFTAIIPAQIITIIWLVGTTNIINWVGGVDGLNITVSSILATTMLIFALATQNYPLALLIAAHLGANLGLLPYNWNPASIFPGTIGDQLNGFLIGVFALLGDTGWTTTMIILALPIVDALIVVYFRFRRNPEVLRNPLKILSISDANHLHHRFLSLGYTRKQIVYIEGTITAVFGSIALLVGINSPRNSIQLSIGFFVVVTLISVLFMLIFTRQRHKQVAIEGTK